MTLRAAVLIPVFNEEKKIRAVLDAVPRDAVDEIVVIDDGSTDATPREIGGENVILLSHPARKGIGDALRTGMRYVVQQKFGLVAVMAGNGKDDPRQIGALLRPIREEGFDYVQGSRYLAGGEYGKMPFHRKVFTRLYSGGVRFLTRARLTDGTNGFRAYRTAILTDPRIQLDQPWVGEALEYYISIKVIKLGYKVTEVPVSKLYPATRVYKEYTKVKPFSGWWRRIRPLVYLSLGIRQ